jgi:hypothetical protein
MDTLRNKAIASLNELRGIKDDYVYKKIDTDGVIFLFREKMMEFEQASCLEEEFQELYQIYKWHSFNMLYSIIGNRAIEVDPLNIVL